MTTISVRELAGAFKADAELTKYRSTTLQVTDTVSSIEPNNGLIICRFGPELLDMFMFVANHEYRQPWAWIAPGQRVTLRRLNDTRASSVLQVFEWSIVEAGPNPAPILAAEALADEFIRDGILAAQKYHGQPVYVTGEVIEKQKDVATSIILKGKGQLNVALHCGFLSKTLDDSIHVGQVICGLGTVSEFGGFDPSTNVISLYSGAPITIPFPISEVEYAKSMASRNHDRVEQMRAASPEFELTVEELAREMRNDLKAAERKYGIQCAELTGAIETFNSIVSGDRIEFARDSGNANIRCRLLECEPWKSYSPGQQVTVRGRFPAFGGMDLQDAVIVSSNELAKPFEIFAAEKLVSLCSKDPYAFSELWKGRRLEVDGVLESLDETRAGFRLKGVEGYSIDFQCHWRMSADSPYLARLGRHHVGDQLRVLATFDSVNSDDKVVQLKEAWERTVSKPVSRD